MSLFLAWFGSRCKRGGGGLDAGVANVMDWKINRLSLGEEGQPLIVIDDFHPDPDRLRQEAAARDFTALAPSYPGLRAPVYPGYFKPLLQGLGAILREDFGFARGARLQECFFSLITTRPEALKPAQTIPHFDGVGDGKVALLHYLSDGAMGGTAFYRHRRTGYESVTEERFAPYKAAVEQDAAEHGPFPKAYFSGSDRSFERIGRVAGKKNRAVLYRGVSLHAVDIDEDFAFDPDPATGRLTVNTFLLPG